MSSRSLRKFDSPHLRAIREKKIKRKKKIFLRIFILFIFLLVSFLVCLNLPFMKFDSFVLTDNKVLTEDEVSSFMKENLSGRLYLVLPKNNMVFFDRNKLEQDLKDRFSRIQNLKFYRNGHTLVIKVKEYEGSYLWCGVEFSKESDCYLLDSSGHIFDKSPYFSGSAYVRFYGPSGSSMENVIGQEFVNENDFNQYIEMMDSLSYLGFEVSRFVVLSEKQIDIHVDTGTNEAHIYMYHDEKFAKRINDLALSLTKEPLLAEANNKFVNLEYLDIRFDDKIYYKLRPTF